MRELRGVQQFWWAFWRSLWRHRKRGNTAIPPLGIVKSWRCGQCARYVVTGRHVPRFILVMLSGCALSPGQLDATKTEAHDSCVQLVILGNPVAGASSATATIPVSALPKLGVLPLEAAATVPTNSVMMTCTVKSDHH